MNIKANLPIKIIIFTVILDSIGISIIFFKLTLEEIQSNSIKEIAIK